MVSELSDNKAKLQSTEYEVRPLLCFRADERARRLGVSLLFGTLWFIISSVSMAGMSRRPVGNKAKFQSVDYVLHLLFGFSPETARGGLVPPVVCML